MSEYLCPGGSSIAELKLAPFTNEFNLEFILVSAESAIQAGASFMTLTEEVFSRNASEVSNGTTPGGTPEKSLLAEKKSSDGSLLLTRIRTQSEKFSKTSSDPMVEMDRLFLTDCLASITVKPYVDRLFGQPGAHYVEYQYDDETGTVKKKIIDFKLEREFMKMSVDKLLNDPRFQSEDDSWLIDCLVTAGVNETANKTLQNEMGADSSQFVGIEEIKKLRELLLV